MPVVAIYRGITRGPGIIGQTFEKKAHWGNVGVAFWEVSLIIPSCIVVDARVL